MAKFEMRLLATGDGSWDQFREDWVAQCAEVDDIFEEYAPDSLKVVAEIVAGTMPSVGGDNETHIGALWDGESERYYACCMLNRVSLPRTEGRTLRIRHLLVSPLIDYGAVDISMYPDVLIGILTGVIHLSSTNLEAEHIRLHLRSPEDQSFFRAFGTNLSGSGVFATVQTHGAWLYITKSAGDSPGNVAADGETK